MERRRDLHLKALSNMAAALARSTPVCCTHTYRKQAWIMEGCSRDGRLDGMRVLIAPDNFADALTAREAAAAIAEGWAERAPSDELILTPMSDGGPGFVDVLHAALGGELLAATVTGPLHGRVPAVVLRVGNTAYIESAQVVGLHLVPPGQRDFLRATTYGIGELIQLAVEDGAVRLVVAVSDSVTNDGGAGLLAALGAQNEPAGTLNAGPAGLLGLETITLDVARDRLAGVSLVLATDVDNPLLGLRGTTNVFGPRKGMAREQLYEIDGALTRLAHAAGREPADTKGAGAGGGLGYALLLLGAEPVSAGELVANAVNLPGKAASADLVITGAGGLDPTSVSGTVVSRVAAAAVAAARPCVVLADRVEVSARELRAHGIESAYATADLVSSDVADPDHPAERLAALAARVARTWSRR
jgi:glycerate kinase